MTTEALADFLVSPVGTATVGGAMVMMAAGGAVFIRRIGL